MLVHEQRKLISLRLIAAISDYDNIIVPDEDSIVPVQCDRHGIPKRIVPNAVGVTWLFKEAGMFFEIGEQRFKTDEVGATVEFTEKGVNLSKITKLH